MLKLGILSELGDGENLGYARVDFDEQGVVSPWVALPSFATKTAKHWLPIEVGSQVAVLMDEWQQQGVIVYALWSEVDKPPAFADGDSAGMQFADGTTIKYNSSTHKMAVEAPDAEVAIECKKFTIKDADGKLQALLDAIKDLVNTFQVNTPSGPSAGISGVTPSKLMALENAYKDIFS